MDINKVINNSLFGSRKTEDLTSEAFEVKKESFGRTISYSPKVFIPLTTLCQDSCAYCTFVKSPNEGGTYLNMDEVESIASVGESSGCYEALFTLGDKPELKWDFALQELNSLGYSSTHDYLTANMKNIHEKYNIFPHANPGLMNSEEIIKYKKYSPSGGLMLESFSPQLLEQGRAHYKAKTKRIELRIETLNHAQLIKYPMTTGLLIGITESKEELINDIIELVKICNENSSIQEIILQNFRAKKNTLMKNNAEVTNDLFLRIIATVRILLPTHISLQVPPNLLSDVNIYLTSGINDFGGISPKTIDWVNPDHLWPDIQNLENAVNNTGQVLIKRLPVYPNFINNEWLSPPVLEKVSNVIDSDGYAKSE
ncbi:MAG: 7,8-didemethyl-8-hydroxy-5-deazariboflavin synthase CofG [Candidatus Actinomarinaceae bacterium]